MKLIIDISEEEYKEVLEDTYSGTPYENKIFTIIANGTPLPKGHGRLIDADALYGDFIDGTEGYDCQTWNRIEIGDIIEDAPTIIEADSESCPCIHCCKITSSEYCSKVCPDYKKWEEGRANEHD